MTKTSSQNLGPTEPPYTNAEAPGKRCWWQIDRDVRGAPEHIVHIADSSTGKARSGARALGREDSLASYPLQLVPLVRTRM